MFLKIEEQQHRTNSPLTRPLLHLGWKAQPAKGTHSFGPESVCASVCVCVSELPCGQTAIECPIQAEQVALPRGVKNKQQSAQHSEQLPHEVGKSGLAS